jgi:hypothetical protein
MLANIPADWKREGCRIWLGALKMGKWLGTRRLTKADFLDFYDPSKIKLPISQFTNKRNFSEKI